MTIRENTAKDLFDQLYEIIGDTGAPDEQKSKLYWLLEDKVGLSKTAIAAKHPVKLTEIQWQGLLSDVEKIKRGFPVQHIIGKTWFYGYELKVNEHVLIPRPETEELVHLIITENKGRTVKILDVGTGSGCIPIVLKLEIPSSEVTSIDISGEALEIAKKNASSLDANVNFLKEDIFKMELNDVPKQDVIVSNPPYVPESEKKTMQPEVLKHEPHLALFVEDSDPLIFYKKIAGVGQQLLNVGGKLYFEIHENYGSEVASLLREEHYEEVRIIKDIHDKDRIVTAIK